MHRNSQLLFDRYARSYFQSGMRVLEIGPASHPSHYARAVQVPELTWHTIDISAHPSLTFQALDEYRFPIKDDSYDIVLSGQVLEHVRRIWVWIGELARVCKPGGHIITISPVSWPYHEAPVDCWRVFPEGMRTLYAEAALDVVMSRSESLEAEGLARVIYGRGRDWQTSEELRIMERCAPLGAPVECSLDTITIGRKPEG